MFNKHHLSMKLSDLEFVEELSEVEVGTVAGGAAEEIADTLVASVLKDVSQKRAKAESAFAEQFPGLEELVFGPDGPDSQGG